MVLVPVVQFPVKAFAPRDATIGAHMRTEGGRVEAERTLFAGLLDLAASAEPAAGLKAALAQLAQVTQAERGYLELYRDDTIEERRVAVSYDCSEAQEAEIRAVISRGIAASAIASGSTVHTPIALLDQRFSANDSVQRQRLEAVLCVPLPATRPGVLYLEGRRGAGPFSPDDVALAERVGRFLGPVLDRATPTSVAVGPDATTPFRSRLQLKGIVGRSPALAHIFEQVGLAAPLDITVLIAGESGTGKTQIARAIHDNSPRRTGPFVELNCAAIPDTLVEAELFGSREGAFTGARRTAGKVEAAERGTLFLDEIGELPLSAQAKLLQLLQSKQYYVLGSSQQVTANVRIIAASNAPLEALAQQKRFREDLFYRLNAFSFRMPSLKDRREDLQPLVDELLARIAFDHALPRLPPSLAFRSAIEGLEWPGNVRQLRNRLETALIRGAGEGVPQLEPRHLGLTPAQAAAPTFHEATRVFQRELLARELKATQWSTAEVAQRLDLSRSQVYNLIKAFGLVDER
jgi:Nif-specific regulatory protein